MLGFFAATLMLSATLLFIIQPMVARMLLPMLGGSAAVWTTCMLFFQIALLAGYGYAHGLAGRISTRRWVWLHASLMVVAAATLPLSFEGALPDANAPLSWLLGTLALRVAPTFVLIAASAPMLQYWVASTNHPAAGNPYRLYAASNIGSMLALLGYPLAVEPVFGVHTQTMAFTVGYLVLAAMIVAGGRMAATSQANRREEPLATEALTWRRRGKWLLLAAVPSSLMLGVTTYITTDLVSVPLLWVAPLAIYLATFIAVFANRPRLFPSGGTPALVLGVVFSLALASSDVDFVWVALAQMLLFGLLVWALHSQLATDKPAPGRLTEFFLILSVGGAIGGGFNAAIAPALLDYAIDYHLALLVALPLLAWPIRADQLRIDPWKYIAPVLLGAIGLWELYEVGFLAPNRGTSVALVGGGLLALGALVFWKPRLLKLAGAVLVCVAAFEAADTRGLVDARRSFFGAYKVFDRESRGDTLRKFSHGTTAHGAQFLGDKEGLPTAYHHPSGPVGQILGAIPHERVAVVGLGAGAMAAYAGPGHVFDFFEIDPLVEELARQHFTYLSRCGQNCTVTIGDGRRELIANDKHYDIIFLDAYNSDSVPMHLLTKQAHEVYRAKTKDHGLIVYHVSNRYLRIASAVGVIAKDAGETCWVQLHLPSKELVRNEKVMPSMYAVVAASPDDLAPLRDTGTWQPCPVDADLWTDDFGSILRLIK
ncbi:MAG: fused MFS/spermidine synthase [bacterium]